MDSTVNRHEHDDRDRRPRAGGRSASGAAGSASWDRLRAIRTQGGVMIIEQLLKEWIAERSAASDLTVAARTAKSIASEIEGYYQDVVARAEGAALEKAQLLAERERKLDQSLEVIARLEGQLAQLRDKTDRLLAEKDGIVAAKDRLIETNAQVLLKLEAQFGAVREKLEGRLQGLEKELGEKTRTLAAREDSLARLEKELAEKMRLVETYREKFGVIMKAVG
jgi:chromosome segregation ATPase